MCFWPFVYLLREILTQIFESLFVLKYINKIGGTERPTYQKLIVIKKTVYYSSQEEGACHAGKGHVGKHQGCHESREEIGGTCGQERSLQFTEKETDAVGQASFELTSLNIQAGSGSSGTISVIGSGVLRAGV